MLNVPPSVTESFTKSQYTVKIYIGKNNRLFFILIFTMSLVTVLQTFKMVHNYIHMYGSVDSTYTKLSQTQALHAHRSDNQENYNTAVLTREKYACLAY